MAQKGLGEKVNLLNKVKEEKEKNQSLTTRQLAALVGVSKSTLHDWQKNEARLREEYDEAVFRGSGLAKKRQRTGKEKDVENAINEWFDAMRSHGQPLTGSLIRPKALEFANALGVEDFTASEGWLSRWKKRKGIVWKRAHGEAASANVQNAEEWIRTELRGILERYSADRVFNADETGLFFRAVPDGSLCYATEKLKGSKKAMDRLTILVCTNMDGTVKKKLFVIGRARCPRCFKGLDVTKLPVTYKANKKAWMTAVLFENWLKEWDNQLEGKPKICLLLDNCTAHPNPPSFAPKNIELIFLPPNTTSLIQPMDQGIIKNLKVRYRAELVKRMLSIIEEKKLSSQSSAMDFSQKVSVLDAINYIARSWRNVTSQTIANCWRHAGFVSDVPSDNDEAVSHNDLSDVLLAEVTGRAEFEAVDNDIVCMGGPDDLELTEAIVARIQRTDEESEADEGSDEFEEPPAPQVKHSEAKSAVSLLQGYMLQQGLSDEVWQHMDALAAAVEENAKSKRIQTSLDNFFKCTTVATVSSQK